MQMQRYIRFARRLNPTITPEGRRTMVECYRALRENDCVGRNKVLYFSTNEVHLYKHTRVKTRGF